MAKTNKVRVSEYKCECGMVGQCMGWPEGTCKCGRKLTRKNATKSEMRVM